MKIKKNIEKLRAEIPSEVVLIAVTKYQTEQEISSAYQAGLLDFGEARVADLAKKSLYFEKYSDIRWHFIGHLQSNKISALLKVKNLVMIHSIDSLKLLQALFAKENYFEGDSLSYFLQVNSSDEEEKFGMNSIEDIYQCIELGLKTNSKFRLHGLMTIGKIRTDNFQEDAVTCFSKLRNIKKTVEERVEKEQKITLDLKLSMGMSSDYKIAIEEGSDFVRIGTAIFE